MEAIAIQEEKVEFRSDGFLVTPELWDEEYFFPYKALQ